MVTAIQCFVKTGHLALAAALLEYRMRCLKMNEGPETSGEAAISVTVGDALVEMAIQDADKGAYRKLKKIFAEHDDSVKPTSVWAPPC